MNFKAMASQKTTELYDARIHLYEKGMAMFRYFVTLRKFLETVPLKLPSHHPKILDLGCGPGNNTPALLKRFPQAKITAFDGSENMLNRYHRKYPSIPLIYGNYNDLPDRLGPSTLVSYPNQKPATLADNEFDLIVSTCSFSEYATSNEAFLFVKRILKPKGQFLSIGVRNHIFGLLSGMYWNFNPRSEKSYMEILSKNGFQNIRQCPIPIHLFPMNLLKYAVICEK